MMDVQSAIHVLMALYCVTWISASSETTVPAPGTTMNATTASLPQQTTTTKDRSYYEVSPVSLGGEWEWTLNFYGRPFNENNFVNSHATDSPVWQDGNWSAILAGSKNVMAADYSNIGGGSLNTISGDYSNIRGGIRNTAKGDYSTIGGGAVNKVHSNYGTIMGGYKNTVKGRFGVVLGGARNIAAGRFSVVAGLGAEAREDYSSVFQFDSSIDCPSMGENTVRFCAKRVFAGGSKAGTDLIKLFDSIDITASRQLHSDDILATLTRAEERLDAIAERLRKQRDAIHSAGLSGSGAAIGSARSFW